LPLVLSHAMVPESCRVEIQSLLTDQLTEVDIHFSPEAVPTRKSFWLDALEIPEGIAHVLLQPRPLASPVTEKVTMRSLPRFVTVRAGERFLLRSLRTNWKSE
jgi:hypothetical protein